VGVTYVLVGAVEWVDDKAFVVCVYDSALFGWPDCVCGVRGDRGREGVVFELRPELERLFG